jgi:endo-1,4-beta-D-glucanase Y
VAAIFLAAISFAATAFSRGQELPDETYLDAMWPAYKNLLLHSDGYIFDQHNNGGEVTSEGQSYALLRAVWMDDQAAFDKVLTWTEHNLKRSDGLYAWQWVPDNGGKVKDWNTATDADQDIAFALILASFRFDNPDYLAKASTLVRAIREHTGIPLGDGWFPSAGNWAVEGRIVNISYFMPYEYPYFDRLDPQGGWLEVREAGYRLLQESRDQGAQLPPDFAVLGSDGTLEKVPEYRQLSNSFSFDAMRIYWRVAMDCLLHEYSPACSDPLDLYQWVGLITKSGKIYTKYTTRGEPLTNGQSTSFFGSLYPAMRLTYPVAAKSLLAGQLTRSKLDKMQKDRNRYYDLNWVWFGLAAESGLLKERTPGLEALDKLLGKKGST